MKIDLTLTRIPQRELTQVGDQVADCSDIGTGGMPLFLFAPPQLFKAELCYIGPEYNIELS